ncbi:hypothetical protein CEV33_2881 [Brucella grignonensis]|uniref:Uncharacterized protein n=1 Tax=Brucella grignonensis TaxID=94627 RepID=A0A256F2U0_9HYPH|nr:hypothetical protein CEV33_2881 [Brucella grignonensis]
MKVLDLKHGCKPCLSAQPHEELLMPVKGLARKSDVVRQ